MGAYNRLNTTVQCPRCQSVTEIEVDCYFGFVSEMRDYNVGDSYQWVPRKSVQHGGRPESGDIDGEGYAECPICEKDFFVKVVVRNDVIQGVEPDPGRQQYISD